MWKKIHTLSVCRVGAGGRGDSCGPLEAGKEYETLWPGGRRQAHCAFHFLPTLGGIGDSARAGKSQPPERLLQMAGSSESGYLI